MRTEAVLVDTGPLVALFRENEAHHEQCKAAFGRLGKGLPTTWPVLTEACFLLRRDRAAVLKLARFVQEGLLVPRDLDSAFAAWFSRFVERFGDREPQLADASLVYLAERDGFESIFTLDARDFSVYRTGDGRALRLLP